jgi:integral membrane sensor domain MASE1
MIKIILKFIGGFIVGSILAFAFVYVFGSIMESLNVSLYNSESDQQRNFNIYFIFTLLLATVSGYFATKIGNKTNK